MPLLERAHAFGPGRPFQGPEVPGPGQGGDRQPGAALGWPPAGSWRDYQPAFWDIPRRSAPPAVDSPWKPKENDNPPQDVDPAPTLTPAALKSKSDRELRLRLRGAAQRMTDSKAVRKCGRALANAWQGSTVSLRVIHPLGGHPRAFFAGLYRCSSVWECPVCAPRIQRGRAEEVQELNKRHAAAGGAMYMATLTVPHDQGDRLEPMRRHVSKTWTRILNGKPWARWKSRLGLIGYVRALESTHGPNGWHPHLHVALYTTARVAARELVHFRAWLRARWEKKVTTPTPEGLTYRAPAWRHGVKVTELRTSNYLTKMGLAAWELTSASTKAGRQGHRTPFQVLRDIVQGAGNLTRQRRDVGVWREWAAAMPGARQLVYSPGLRKRFRLGEEVPDAALPDGQGELELAGGGDGAELLHTFTPEEWRAVCRSRSSVAIRCRLLGVVDLARHLWRDEIVRIVDGALGLDPVPF